MAKEQPAYDLDLKGLRRLDDGPLVVLAKELDFGPAWDILLRRHEEVSKHLIEVLAQRRGWQTQAIRDAQDHAADWIAEAIRDYDTSQLGKPKPRSFRSFLYSRLVDRFSNYARGRRRAERHLDRSVDATEAVESSDSLAKPRTARRPAAPVSNESDPVVIAERREEMERLQQALSEFDETNQRIFALHVREQLSQPEIAAQLGLTPAQVQHRWRNMFNALKARFRDPDSPKPPPKPRRKPRQ